MFSQRVAIRPDGEGVARGNGGPEFFESFQPAIRRVAGNDGGVDGPDRDTDHPVGFQPGFMQRLIHPGLVRTQSAAALQNQADALAAFRPTDRLETVVKGLVLRDSGIGCHIHAKCLRANVVRLGDDTTSCYRLMRDPAPIYRQRHTGDGCGTVGAQKHGQCADFLGR